MSDLRQDISSFDPEVAPDLIAPVHAFRDWRIGEYGLLESLRAGQLWTTPVQQAQCHPQTLEDFARERHAAPATDCTCGIHCYFRPDPDFCRTDFRGVTGIVTAWGRLEVHANGLRAQYVQVQALGTYQRWTRRQKDLAAQVADELGVELIDVFELEAAAPAFGAAMPRVLTPDADAAMRRVPRTRRRPLVPPVRSLVVGA